MPPNKNLLLTVISYNVHRCIGRDGIHSPERIAAIIRELDPDIVGLQEVDSRMRAGDGAEQLAHLAAATGLEAVAGPNIRFARGHYGNALLTRHPVRVVRRLDLSVPAFEPRGALDVDLAVDGLPVRVLVTHLGLRAAERRIQAERLLNAAGPVDGRPFVLLGDINEWWPRGRPLRLLEEWFGRTTPVRSFPSRWPFLALDRIWALPRGSLVDIRAYDTPETRIASDHLPVRAVVECVSGAERPNARGGSERRPWRRAMPVD